MSPPAAAPHFKPESSWKLLGGMGYGLRQSTLLGRFRIRLPDDFDLAVLDAAIAAMAEDPLPRPMDAPDAATAVACRAAQWMALLQQECNIPVSDRFRAGPAILLDDGATAVPVAMPCFTKDASHAMLDWVGRVLDDLIANRPDAGTEILRERLEALRVRLRQWKVQGINAFHFLRAADHLDIPTTRLFGAVYTFGTGRHTRWLNSSFTDRTGQIGVNLAHSKLATAQVLLRGGLPGPSHLRVTTEAEAVGAAETLGYPVVVKPLDQEQGRGVAAGLAEPDAVREAFATALTFSREILVEKHFHGRDYRLTVVDGRVVKVENRVAGGVTGDGVSTVGQLVDVLQQTPRFRKVMRTSGRFPLSLDAEALGMLGEAGMTADSVPDAGAYVTLRRKNNISTGGMQILVPPERVHPDNRDLAVRAAALLRLDFAGVDLIIDDIATSWLESGALICEVNAQPQVGVNTTPDIYREILASLMRGGHRIPVHLVIVGASGIPAADVRQLLDRLGCNALATPAGVWIDGRKVAARPQGSFHAARIMLEETAAKTALCVIAAGEIVQAGLPTDRFESIRVVGPVEDLETILAMAAPHTDVLVPE
ncbi:MAG: hypothetical protein GC201_15585 [Alphaproteobacteria bacterium]|nr:hypothetical protein [Alphaproteobacteria bacterium]